MTVVASYTVRLNVETSFSTKSLDRAATSVGKLDDTFDRATTNAQKFTATMQALSRAAERAAANMGQLGAEMRMAGFAQIARDAKSAASAVQTLNARMRQAPARARPAFGGLAPARGDWSGGGGVWGTGPSGRGPEIVGRPPSTAPPPRVRVSGAPIGSLSLMSLGRRLMPFVGAYEGVTFGVNTFRRATDFALQAQADAEVSQAMIAASFAMNDGGTLSDARARAAQTFRGLEADAARGVGDLPSYLETFQRGYPLLRTAGFDEDRAREMTRRTVAAGFAYRGVEGARLASIDLQQALEGRISERNTPIVIQALRASGLPADAETFNAASMEQRAEWLFEAFGKAGKAASLFAGTFEAASATFKTNVQQTVRELTAMPFEAFKERLIALNEWMGSESTKRGVTGATSALDALVWSPLGRDLNAVGNAASLAADSLTRLAGAMGPFFEMLPERAQAGAPAATMTADLWGAFNRRLQTYGQSGQSPIGTAAAIALTAFDWLESRRSPDDVLPTLPLENAAKEVKEAAEKEKKVEVRIKVDTRIDWGDDRQVATAFDDFAAQLEDGLGIALARGGM